MRNSIDKAKDVLKASNYLVSIKGDGKKCTLSLPKRKMSPLKKAQTISYEMLTGGGVNVTGDADTYWICPDYVTRTSIWYDIVKRCKEYEYSILAIHMHSEEIEEAKSILEIMDHPESVTLDKELQVLDLALALSQNINIGTLTELREEASRRDVLDGFDFLISNFVKGIL